MADDHAKRGEHPEDCKCLSHQFGWTGKDGCACGYHHHSMWHAFAKILAALIIFWLGTQYGELRVYSMGYYGMMGRYDRGGYDSFRPSGYDSYGSGTNAVTPSPVAPTASPTAQ